MNWRRINKPALCCNRQAEEERAQQDNVLAGAVAGNSIWARQSSLVGCNRGVFLSNGFLRSPRGSEVAVVIWHSWQGKFGRGPYQECRSNQMVRRRTPARPGGAASAGGSSRSSEQPRCGFSFWTEQPAGLENPAVCHSAFCLLTSSFRDSRWR